MTEENIQHEIAQGDKRVRVKNRAKRMIWVTFQREGIHMYPGADTNPELATGDRMMSVS